MSGTAKRHPPRRPIETVAREISARAHETARYDCGGLLRWSVDPMLGTLASTCDGCGARRTLQRVAIEAPERSVICPDCGVDRREVESAYHRRRRDRSCDTYCAACCKRHAAAGDHSCTRSRILASQARYNAMLAEKRRQRGAA